MKQIIKLVGMAFLAVGIMISPIEAEEKVQSTETDTYKMFCLARLDYEWAKLADSNDERNRLYAQAIGNISQAVSEENPNSTYLILGSQIYRGKGVNSYAKQYFIRAEQLMLERLEQEPDSIVDNLNYAIACYAGDSRFWPNYPEYQEKAEKYAKKTLALCIETESINDSENLMYMAMAKLILGEQGECRNLLWIARDNMDSQDTKANALLTQCFDLYESTVAKNQWLWDVRAESIDKEFLLYYLAQQVIAAK